MIGKGKFVSGIISILIIWTIFLSGCVMEETKEVIPISALEAWQAIEKDIESEYPDAELTKVFAGTKQGFFVVRPRTWEKEEGELSPILGANDGRADKWQITLYSPSKKLYVFIDVTQYGKSEVSTSITTREYTSTYLLPSNISTGDWKIDSTDAVEIINNETGIKSRPWSITLDYTYISGHGREFGLGD